MLWKLPATHVNKTYMYGRLGKMWGGGGGGGREWRKAIPAGDFQHTLRFLGSIFFDQKETYRIVVFPATFLERLPLEIDYFLVL